MKAGDSNIPLAYYNECISRIILSEQHRPDENPQSETFARLLGLLKSCLITLLGSNADLSIVGGSILSRVIIIRQDARQVNFLWQKHR